MFWEEKEAKIIFNFLTNLKLVNATELKIYTHIYRQVESNKQVKLH